MIWFAKDLALKNMKRSLFGEVIWSQITKEKYLRNILVVDWIRGHAFKPTKGSSIIWEKNS